MYLSFNLDNFITTLTCRICEKIAVYLPKVVPKSLSASTLFLLFTLRKASWHARNPTAPRLP